MWLLTKDDFAINLTTGAKLYVTDLPVSRFKAICLVLPGEKEMRIWHEGNIEAYLAEEDRVSKVSIYDVFGELVGCLRRGDGFREIGEVVELAITAINLE